MMKKKIVMTIAAAAALVLIATAIAASVVMPKHLYIGRRNLVVDGKGETLTLKNDPAVPVLKYGNGFVFVNCTNVIIRNWRITTSHPVGTIGKIVKIEPNTSAFEVKLPDDAPATGNEHLIGVNTIDTNGIPDKVIDIHGRAAKYSVAEDHRLRISVAGQNADMSRLFVGQSVALRYSVYGPVTMTFIGCSDVTIEDVEIERASGTCIVIHPSSRNFTFRRVSIGKREAGSEYFFSGADGIHVAGLSGRLKLEDCHFAGLGDDALNVHAKSAEVVSVKGKKLKLAGRGRDRELCALPRKWARVGDELVVYDAKTLLEKARGKIGKCGSRINGRYNVVFADDFPGIAAGDLVGNVRDYPETEVTGSTFERTRARGLLLQTEKILVRDCSFRDMSLPGIIVSPDFRYWNECGPTRDCAIEDCAFERCAFEQSHAAIAAIVVKTSHDHEFGDYPPGVHKNVRIKNCRFINARRFGIFAQSVDGMEIAGNTFAGCEESKLENVR